MLQQEHEMALGYSQFAAMRDRYLGSSSPAPSVHQPQEELPRLMNLRILYTFDQRADSQCLAKSSHAIPIRAVVMPDGSQIGEIQLKTCLQAVLRASPEIYSEEVDYTVYAFDPSEQGSPRVGHGKLSQIIRSSDSQDGQQPMVMGVVKNNLTFLPSLQQVQDNLEVRIVLNPVQAREQADTGFRSPFIQDRPQSPRVAAYPDFNNLLSKLDPQLLVMLQQMTNSGAQGSAPGSDALQRFMNTATTSNIGYAQQMPAGNTFIPVQPATFDSRCASPAPSMGSVTSHASRRPIARSVSNVSQRNLSFIHEQPAAQIQADGYASGEENPPKRARIMQIERPGKTALNKKGDLRMAASTAASVRMHQPTAIRPQSQPTQNLEEPPRVPTPVPQGRALHRRVSTQRSGLQTEMSFSQTSDAGSPYSEANLPSLPNSAATSPEATFRQGVTPEGLGSSPPMIPGLDACPSSPALPPLPIHDDSGFMSGGGLMDMSEIDNCDPRKTLSGQSTHAQGQQSADRRSRTPTVLQDISANTQHLSQSQSKALNALGVKRSSVPPSSDIFLGSEANRKPRGRPRVQDKEPPPRPVWDKEKRRIAMAARLAGSVANGEIPPYCHNCGVIETPTWRRAWSKVHSGEPPVLNIPKGGVKGDGDIIGVEVVEQDPETGKTLLFRIYKKTLSNTDKDFEAISLCNPCGLWLKTRGINRPEKLWHKNNEQEETRKEDIPEREKRPRLARGDEEPQSELAEATVRPAASVAAGPPALPRQLSTMSEPFPTIEREKHDLPHSKSYTEKPREEKKDAILQAQPVKPTSAAASTKSIAGARESPIEVDQNGPSPVRRSLFSSPRSNGPLGVDVLSMKPTSTRKMITPRDDELARKPSIENTDADEPASQNLDTTSQEEQTPCPATPKAGTLQLPIVTPLHNSMLQDSNFSRSPSNLFKTPSKSSRSPNTQRITTSDFFSSSAKKLLHGALPDRTPSKRSTPHSPTAEASHFSPELPRLLRTIYGRTPPPGEDFTDVFDPTRLDSDCCPGNSGHTDDCPRRILDDVRLSEAMDLPMLAELDFVDADFNPSFPPTEEEWAATDAFFASSGITGFTPRKPMTVARE